jgi:hypothetical protein
MKRALAALPLVLLVAVGAFILLRKSASPSAPVVSHGGAEPAASAPPTSQLSAKPPSATPPAPAAKEETGALRFLVTLRGQPASNVQVTVLQAGVGAFGKFKTEADGTQYLHGLPPGEYSIGIEQEDAIPYSGEITLKSGQTIPIQVDLKVGGKVYGTISDRAGKPIAETRVFLTDPETALQCGKQILSDKDGHYELKGIAPGQFGVRFRHLKYKPLDRTGLFFRSSTDEYRIDVTLDLGAWFSGRVLDEANAPIEGADLLASNAESAGQAKSAADGTFTVTGLTDIPANVSASKNGYGTVVLRNLSGNPTDLLLRLPKAGTVLGRVVIDAIPPQTQVTLSRYDEELRRVIPVESQFFSLEPGAGFAVHNIAPGTYWVEVTIEGYEAVDRPQIVVASGQITKPVVISMRKKN